MTDQDRLEILRKSAAELLACAILDLFPKTKLVSSQVSDVGFSYDFLFTQSVDSQILPVVEERMRMLIKENLPVKATEMMRKNAAQFLAHHKQPIRADFIDECEDNIVEIIQIASFYDWCPAPYVSRTQEIGAVKLFELYPLENSQVIRIEGTACENSYDLKKFVKVLEAAKKRDHVLLGQQADLFSESSAGFWNWHPKGMFLREFLLDWWKKALLASNFQFVSTPTLIEFSQVADFKGRLLPSLEMNGIEYVPVPSRHLNHAQLYSLAEKSVDEFPLRYAECGQIYLRPKKGLQSGLLNASEACADQVTIFCSEGQLLSELISSLHFIQQLRTIFGFTSHLVLNTRAKHSLGKVVDWERASEALKEALKASNLDFTEEARGDDLFGPSVGLYLNDALGREWSLFHLAVDVVHPSRMELRYKSKKGESLPPVMVTRSVFGTLERFVALMIESGSGLLPLWLSPEQVRVIPLGNDQCSYAEKLIEQLARSSFRAVLDRSKEGLGSRIYAAEMAQVPYIIIVGAEEQKKNVLSLRSAQEKRVPLEITCESLIARLEQEVMAKSLPGK